MKTINDKVRLKYYIDKYNIDECFEKDMSRFMTLHSYDKGEDILVAGEDMKYFYFVVEGMAKIFNTLENGKTVLLRFTRPLSELGSVEILEDDKIVKSCVQSLFSTTVIRIPFEAIEDHAMSDVKLFKFLVVKLGHKLRTTSNAASMNMTYPFKNRFASYLISITDQLENERVDEIKMTKLTELATFLGTSYRHLNRVIREFEDDGIIKKTKGGFIILNYAELESLSGGFYE